MSKQVKIPLSNNQSSIRFPDKCVYCSQPQEKTVDIIAAVSDKYSTRKGQRIINTTRTYSMKFSTPYCTACTIRADRFKEYQKRGKIVGVALAIVIAVIAYTFNLGNWQSLFSESIVIVIIMIVGVPGLGGVVGWQVSTALLCKDYYDALGLALSFTKDRKAIVAKFTNEALAEEFARINGLSIEKY